MSTYVSTTCANCDKGKDHGVKLKVCTACRSVKYCNRECQLAHHKQHKEECKKLADESLFKDPPPREECPICMLPLPLDERQSVFKSCCGKVLCQGCFLAQVEEEADRGLPEEELLFQCPFCREPVFDDDEKDQECIKKLADNGNPYAIKELAHNHLNGENGFSKDTAKAIQLLIKSGELGCAPAYLNVGNIYFESYGETSRDVKKAVHYYELAAKMGDSRARHNLGRMEADAGNSERAYKHFAIAAKAGFELSLVRMKEGFKYGHVTKDQYTEALRGYQKSQAEMTSANRVAYADVEH